MIIIYLLCAAAILLGIRWMSSPKTAVRGNLTGAAAVLVAIVAALTAEGLLTAVHLWAALAAGGLLGLFFARRVRIVAMPQFVALLNGFGGAASALVALVVLLGAHPAPPWSIWAGALALLVGALTLSGSLVASGKLSGLLPQQPLMVSQHKLIVAAVGVTALAVLLWVGAAVSVIGVVALALAALLFGVLFASPIGGADMPVTISLLNSFSGMAGAIAGFSVNNLLVVAAGGIVGAAGLILTQIMCRGMNRSLVQILTGQTTSQRSHTPTGETGGKAGGTASQAAEILRNAARVILVPGYGMAVSQAQEDVRALLDYLEEHGKDVRVAIHPVAGRMPGHMNVLLAEVDVPYDRLFALEEINNEFKNTDAVVVVGANDVVNPAALEAKGTSIYGMPILNVHESRNIIVCNFDTKPGYAGVHNDLYELERSLLLLGDAKDSLRSLLRSLRAEREGSDLDPQTLEAAAASLRKAKRVMVVPGYGMAVAQAQQEVKRLLGLLEQMETDAKVAIHPVAGRMPGHMNVLLAEVDVSYDQLYALEEINDQFDDVDVAVVVGANDVINPAALEAEGSSIYGMPILNVYRSPSIIICNYDTKPGYSGTDNPLYQEERVHLLLGDAKDVLEQLNDAVASGGS